jgi:mannosyltransferase OCH1-like enzyme
MIHSNICSTKKKIKMLSKKYGRKTIMKKCMPANFVEPENKVIPLHIYQVWHDDNLPSSVKESVDLIKKQNPEFEHHLYDNNKCKKFIKEHFSQEVVDTYDALVPHALKADLWRYCIMYKLGGIYLDSKYYGINKFKFIYLTDKEYFCKDKLFYGIYNAILICKPGNDIMKRCIDKVVENTKKKYYGESPLCPTGPLMMQPFFTRYEITNFKLHYEFIDKRRRYITHQYCRILQYHPDYKKTEAQTTHHWPVYWKNKTLYK